MSQDLREAFEKYWSKNDTTIEGLWAEIVEPALEALELINKTPPATDTEIQINRCAWKALTAIREKLEAK